MALRLRCGSATDVGRVRSDNEDASLAHEHIYAVADGMGGHRGGKVASHIAIETLAGAFDEPTGIALVDAARNANDAVLARANEDPDLHGMGTTLVAIAPVDDEDEPGENLIAWVHVGDSRIYLFRDDELEQLTEDHSLVERWVREGSLSAEEARSHPQRNILTRALGMSSGVGIDSGTVIPYAGDRFVLCSDGLFNEVDEARIAATLRRLRDPQDAAHELVRLALDGGGRDNITVVVVDVDDDGGGAVDASGAVGRGTVEGHAERRVAAGTDRRDEQRTTGRGQRRARRGTRPQWITWRVVVFAILFVAIVLGGLAGIGYSARHAYYVGFRGDSVVIFKGRPGGVLWFHPTVEQVTDVTRGQVPASELDRITSGQEESSLTGAQAYVQSIRDRATPTTSTTTTVTTIGTVPSTSS